MAGKIVQHPVIKGFCHYRIWDSASNKVEQNFDPTRTLPLTVAVYGTDPEKQIVALETRLIAVKNGLVEHERLMSMLDGATFEQTALCPGYAYITLVARHFEHRPPFPVTEEWVDYDGFTHNISFMNRQEVPVDGLTTAIQSAVLEALTSS